MTTPALPYAGTSGYSGSDTSRERAETADADGATEDRQALTLRSLAGRHGTGMTWKELGVARGWHHGQASGTLSVLHKEGRIARLAEERRDRCAVYVHPDYVAGRPVARHGRQSPLDDALREWLTRGPDRWSPAMRDPMAFVKVMMEVTGRD